MRTNRRLAPSGPPIFQMGYRKVKIKLWNENPHCHWCGRLTRLTNNPNGIIPDDAATVDHLYSKFDLRRWVKAENEKRYVLACRLCNWNRSFNEAAQLPKSSLQLRGYGFTINPQKTFDTLEDVIAYLTERGVDISQHCVNVTV